MSQTDGCFIAARIESTKGGMSHAGGRRSWNRSIITVVTLLLYAHHVNCQDDCAPGKYGTGVVNCTIDCPAHCASSLCDRASGLCSGGLCEEGYDGDRCNSQPKCSGVSGDPRGQPMEMNADPGRLMNLFVNLTIPKSGRVSVLQYYAQRSGLVYVDFWRHLNHSENYYGLRLVATISLQAQQGSHDIDVRQDVMVQVGDAIGVHYDGRGNTGTGTLDYHTSDGVSITNISNSDLFSFINSGSYNDGLPLNTIIYKEIKPTALRSVALRVFVECTEDCEPGQYGNDPDSCTPCSANCKDSLHCDPKVGTCPAGCIVGWRNELCQQQCVHGTFGENCLNECDTCLDGNCTAEDGECRSGCTPGYQGTTCVDVCSSGMYGASCNLTCSTHCDDVCNHATGTCTCTNDGSAPTCEIKKSEKQGGDDGGGVNVAIIAGAVVGVVVVLLLVILVLLLYRRKKLRNRQKSYVAEAEVKFSDLGLEDQPSEPTKYDNFDKNSNTPAVEIKETEPTGIYENTQQEYVNDVSKPIGIRELEACIAKEKKANPQEPFGSEYMSIPSNQTEKWDFANQKQLKIKNRFKNIMPYDHNRVELSMIGGDPLSTYINASFLPNFTREKAYIGAGGPSKATIDDFWRMVWEYNSKVIVMVTKLVESMAIKCERYWPASSGELCTYGGITVAMQGEEEWMDFESRILIVTKNGDERKILHLTYTGWPDHGVPQHGAGILKIRKRMLRYQGNATSPIIVHCSAGIGRTGTFIALDYLIDQGHKEQVVDVYGVLNRLRSYRINMVQTKDQYSFIYDVLCQALCYGASTIPCSEFKTKYDSDIKVFSDSGESNMKRKYEFLGRSDLYFYPDEFDEASSATNIVKNRDKSVLPAEKHRIYLTDVNDRGVYINAVQVNGYRRSREFIVTQVPLKATQEDFWSLMLTYKCSTIVCLEDATDGTIWYPGPEGAMSCGKASIKHIDTKLEGNVIQHQFLVEENDESQQSEYANVQSSTTSQQIRMFHLPSWSQTPLVDRNPSTLIQFVKKVEDWRSAHDSFGHIAVVCLNGAKESGLYIAATHLISMINAEEEVDVFQTVKEIRTTRPEFIKHLDQYGFLHTLVLAYLKSPFYLPKHVQQSPAATSSV